MAKQDEFDLVAFSIGVMVLLTALAAGMAFVLSRDIDGIDRKIQGALRELDAMEKAASDEEFKGFKVTVASLKTEDLPVCDDLLGCKSHTPTSIVIGRGAMRKASSTRSAP